MLRTPTFNLVLVSLISCSGPAAPSGDGEAGEVVQAAGKPVKYTVTPSAESGGTITPSTAQQVSSGQSSVAFVSTPTTSPCYVRNGFLLDQDGNGSFEAATATNVTSYTFTNVTSNKGIRASFVPCDSQGLTAAVTPLRHDARGALTYTFDDGLIYPDIVRLKSYMDSSVYTNPSNPADTGSYDLPISYCINTDDLLTQFGTPAELAAAFANLASWATDSRNPIRVCSHSKTHPHLTPATVQVELGTAARVLYNGVKATLSSEQWNAAEPVGMAYPFNDWDSAIATEVLKFHPFGRVADEFEINDSGDAYYAGEPTLLPGSPRYGALHSCVWGVSRTCKAVSFPPGAAPANNGNALSYVKAAIDNNKWMIFNFHTIQIGGQSSGTYALMTESQLKVFLDYAQQQTNAGALYVDGLAEVGKYIKEAQASSVSNPVLSGDTITFTVTHGLQPFSVNDETGSPLYTVEYDDGLTVKLQGVASDWSGATATQGSATLSVNFVGGSLLVDGVVPNAGTVTVTR